MFTAAEGEERWWTKSACRAAAAAVAVVVVAEVGNGGESVGRRHLAGTTPQQGLPWSR